MRYFLERKILIIRLNINHIYIDMHDVRPLLLFTLTFLILFIGCEQEKVDLPAPASVIEGTYIADTYSSRDGTEAVFPIQGKNITLKIISVSKDSIRVEIEAMPNGNYSPGTNKIYEKLFVNQEFETDIVNKKQVSCVTYNVILSGTSINSTNSEFLKRRCIIEGIYYSFISPINKIQATIKFIRI